LNQIEEYKQEKIPEKFFWIFKRIKRKKVSYRGTPPLSPSPGGPLGSIVSPRGWKGHPFTFMLITTFLFDRIRKRVSLKFLVTN